MSKKVLIIIVVLIVLGAVGAGAFFFLQNKNKFEDSIQDTIFNPVSEFESETGTSISVYNDESGFSFKYPSDFVVTDITPANDNSYYSLLEVKNDNDVITITVKDGSYKLPSDAVASPSSGLKLAGFPLKQYEYGEGSLKKAITLANSQGVSYAIDGAVGSALERQAYNLLLTSFDLGKQSTPTSAGGGSGTIDEGEEVVE